MTQAHPNGGKTERKRIKLSFPQNRCKHCSSQLGNISVSTTSRHSPSQQAAMHFLKNASHLYLKPTRIIPAELFKKKIIQVYFFPNTNKPLEHHCGICPLARLSPPPRGLCFSRQRTNISVCFGLPGTKVPAVRAEILPRPWQGTSPRVSAPGGETHGSRGTGVSSAPPCPSQPRREAQRKRPSRGLRGPRVAEGGCGGARGAAPSRLGPSPAAPAHLPWCDGGGRLEAGPAQPGWLPAASLPPRAPPRPAQVRPGRSEPSHNAPKGNGPAASSRGSRRGRGAGTQAARAVPPGPPATASGERGSVGTGARSSRTSAAACVPAAAWPARHGCPTDHSCLGNEGAGGRRGLQGRRPHTG